MKKIESIIKTLKLDDVKTKLQEIGIQRLSVLEARGFRRHKGHAEHCLGAEHVVDFLPKIKIELVVPDNLLDRAVEIIATTAKIGDGKIFVSSIKQAIRIRKGEDSLDAL